MAKASATIRDVARMASVSTTTVSMVLNDSGKISPQTRRRVQQILQRLDYRRRPAGRPRQAASCHQVALIHPRLPASHNTSGWAQSMTLVWLDAIREEMIRRGQHLGLFGGHASVHDDGLFCSVARRGDIDGAILLASSDDGYLEWMQSERLPVVVINRRPKPGGPAFSYVDIDNAGGGRLAAEHLVNYGHRRMAVLAARQTPSYTTNRVAGFVEAVESYGLERPGVHELPRIMDANQIDDLAEGLQRSGVTGVFCTTDGLAIPMLNACHRIGLPVPERISIIGFDDVAMVSDQGLRPTSVGVDHRVVAQAAAGRVLELIDSRGQLQFLSATVATAVNQHDTSGPVPNSARQGEAR